MKRCAFAVAVILAAAAQSALAAAPATTEPAVVASTESVPVRTVVLYSSGVGYFEHFGTVHGNGVETLSFTDAQINDVLKSLVLQDLDGGTVAAVTYRSQDPLAKTLAGFGIDLSSNPSLAELLNQLRGSSVTAIVGGEVVHGTILGLEQRQKILGGGPNTVVEQEWQLNLVANGVIRAVPLDNVTSLGLDDPHLQQQLTAALAAVASSRDKDKRPVTIHFSGTGDRHVRIGYVVEAPVWRASYRLILGDAQAKKDADLQGWAIVQNPTDADWDHVQLSLVSGRPISFVEDLDQPMYLPRPVVVPKDYAGLQPPSYENGMAPGVAKQMAAQATALPEELNRSRALGGAFAGARMQDQSMQPMDATVSIASLARGTDLGELFQYTVPDVSLAGHQASMIPIVTDKIDAQRVSIYNASVLPRNPLNGALLRNNTGKHLLAGPMTVIDGSAYAGDAQLDNLPPGQHRLISYGIDLQMAVDASDNREESSVIGGKIVHGVLTVFTRDVMTQKYVAQNSAGRDKTLVIEHPRRGDGWALVNTAAPMESTDAVYRFELPVAAGKQATLNVAEQTTTSQEIGLLSADMDVFGLYRTTGSIPKAVQDALGKAAQMKQDIAVTQQQIALAKATLAAITAEQGRIRDDLRIANASSDYRNRLMKKLDDQETQIEQTQTAQADLQKKLEGEQAGLVGYLNGLDVG